MSSARPTEAGPSRSTNRQPDDEENERPVQWFRFFQSFSPELRDLVWQYAYEQGTKIAVLHYHWKDTLNARGQLENRILDVDIGVLTTADSIRHVNRESRGAYNRKVGMEKGPFEYLLLVDYHGARVKFHEWCRVLEEQQKPTPSFPAMSDYVKKATNILVLASDVDNAMRLLNRDLRHLGPEDVREAMFFGDIIEDPETLKEVKEGDEPPKTRKPYNYLVLLDEWYQVFNPGFKGSTFRQGWVEGHGVIEPDRKWWNTYGRGDYGDYKRYTEKQFRAWTRYRVDDAARRELPVITEERAGKSFIKPDKIRYVVWDMPDPKKMHKPEER
ncbi:hypothetical protein F4780DRAFT_784256 [Xylariomycetidae sp. FL0641]|nr:hypothetical protein F4780DRAFT_784256 [Xylariomycetidae sp. FL0641]